jgi:hypothetical protein
LYLKDRFDPKPPIPEEEKIILEIINKLIEDPNSKLTFAPVSNKRFIKNTDKDVYVVIEKNIVSITNNIYTHSTYITDYDFYDGIIVKFDNSLDIQRMKLENEISMKVKNTLQSILQRISE